MKDQNRSERVDVTIRTYLFLMERCPLIRFVGITGTSAMVGKRKSDDLDLCVVTRHRLLWTTRFFTVILAKMLGIHSSTGICLNLFFEEADLAIPLRKQNSYIAHELLQMKPLIDKGGIHERFLAVNEWIYRYFPNAKSRIANRETRNVSRFALHDSHPTLHEYLDHLFKSFQLPHVIRNRTAYTITPTQLWLFKSDFEKKLKRRGLVI